MIEMRRAQLSFGDGLIVEEVRDLREDWMQHADQVLEDEQIVAAVYEALARRHPKKAFSPRPAPSYSCSCASEECRLHTPSISLT
jgi:hypothetical protein